ncbi:chromosome segregation protein SMC [Sphingomonas oleivorans]|uniref:Chromosome partition protein Smc n=1 Tax=Sphingomonas oleivorans TaxID=1735121 RepID=A0A2T5FXQ4_9SPHN|nr:chromosome segregation protein SMC [Sphingomonas oleivorans]PTQ10920.1 chromosome segregation protein SMC [Sphingomonas oleivorans]
MKIKKLRLSGFKSFVEPAELIIEPGLTGVVGPNGCGKSNLLEAIRWAMGETSSKSLRGGGMEDVIFAGTATRAKRDFAEVTILTESPGEQGPEETEVVRRIERGAGSAYRINGRDVRQRDVALMFADAATGAHSPALVSQGRIAAVIAAKPIERRQMLEEAAGIAGLHVRRREAEQKLRGTEANLARLDDLLGDMESRANSLRRQARTAERYRALSTQIRVAEGRTIFARWREAARAADAAVKEAAAAGERVSAAAEAQRAAAAHQAAAIRTVAEARAAAQSAREAASEAGHRLAALRTERASVERRLRELAEQRDALARDRMREDRLAIDASEALARLAEEEKVLTLSLGEAEAQRGELETKVAEAERAARDGEVELARAMAAQAAEQAEARVAQAALAQARQRLDRAVAECQRIDRELAALGDDEAFHAALDTARAARAKAEAAIAAAIASLAEAEARRDAASTTRDRAESEGASARAALAALESEARALAKGLESGGTKALAQIRAAPGYERALAAALGDDLDAPIGDKGPRGWAGSERKEKDPTLPKGVTALNEHVNAPPELSRRLAQIGVVKTDDGGIDLAVGQRLVTHDGRLRRWDGYVARDVGAAAAERLIRANRLAELERSLPSARDMVEQAAAALAAASATLGEVRAAIDAARRAQSEGEAAARMAIREEDAAAARIERHTAARASLAERQSRASAEREEAEGAEAAARAALAALPDGEATRQMVDGLRVATEAARAALAEARAHAAALVQRIEADGRRLQAVRAEAKGWRSRAGDAARRIDEMAKRMAAVESELASLATMPAELDGKLAELAAEVQAADAAAAMTQEAEHKAGDVLRRSEKALAESGEALASAREARAGAVARQEHAEARRVELGRLSGERFECPAPVLPEKAGFASAEVGDAASEAARHDRLIADRERLGPVNLVAETELNELEQGHAAALAEREELGQAINRLRGSIGNLNREGRARLLAAFEAVDGHFRRLFTTLFAGGEAHLALIDSEDPLEAGLEIMAQPPGKKLAALTLLSGGEQALTAVALIFALFLTNPAPICVLDEVDAPLDDANIERFCDMLDRMVRETETRYLIVTHNSVTMSRMHRLFGVTMIERGVSRLVSVDLGGAESLLAAE